MCVRTDRLVLQTVWYVRLNILLCLDVLINSLNVQLPLDMWVCYQMLCFGIAQECLGKTKNINNNNVKPKNECLWVCRYQFACDIVSGHREFRNNKTETRYIYYKKSEVWTAGGLLYWRWAISCKRHFGARVAFLVCLYYLEFLFYSIHIKFGVPGWTVRVQEWTNIFAIFRVCVFVPCDYKNPRVYLFNEHHLTTFTTFTSFSIKYKINKIKTRMTINKS